MLSNTTQNQTIMKLYKIHNVEIGTDHDNTPYLGKTLNDPRQLYRATHNA